MKNPPSTKAAVEGRPTIILLRGLPGSGKSTLAKELAGNWVDDVFEADQYFMTDEGYRYDVRGIGAAHAWCSALAERSLLNSRSVAIANTFSRIREMERYFLLSQKYDTDLMVVRCSGEYDSIHGVPTYIIERMRDRWESYPEEIPAQHIRGQIFGFR